MTWIKKSEREVVRATECLNRLTEALASYQKAGLEIGKQLHQIKNTGWYKVWGFDSFWRWFDANEEMFAAQKICRSKAFYLINMADLLRIVPESKITNIPAEKLRDIASLDCDKNRALINDLVNNHARLSSGMVKNAARKAKGYPERKEYGPYWAVEKDSRVVERAFRAAKANRNITDTEAFVIVCTGYLESLG